MMDIHKILTDCDTLETTISILIKDNSCMEANVARLQARIFESTRGHLDQTLERERELQCLLDEVAAKRQLIESEIKQYTTINEKLSNLVSIAQKKSSQNIEDDTLVAVIEADEEYAQFKTNFNKGSKKLQELEDTISSDKKQVETIISENAELIIDLHRNDKLIRVLEQQNKYSEQQFDLVLNQIPWEPLTKQYIENLLASQNKQVVELSTFIQVQANEIEELNDSLTYKKKKKLETLENLLSKINQFIQRRDEAVTVAKLTD